MRQGTTHIIGAGLAGLSAATKLAERGGQVIVYEAATHAGGRCRSYDDAAFGGVIDNGNHLLLSGNRQALAYLRRIGADGAFSRPGKPVFDFADAQTGERWALRLSSGLLPFWLFDQRRRVPGTRPADYLPALRLLNAQSEQTVTQLLDDNTPLYRRLWHTLLLSALNTHPKEASAQLAGAIVRGTFLKGGSACIPLIAEGLSARFIDPALAYLAKHGAPMQFGRRLRRIDYTSDFATALEFADGELVLLGKNDRIICAVPAPVATQLLPDVSAPDAWRSILNVHFRIAPPAQMPAILGVINASVEWIFAFPDRISVTISDANRFMQDDREALAQRIWQEVASVTGLACGLPPWQIVKEKRATFAATPEQDAKRPGSRTALRNVYLAGDWVQTGLPATIEGAVYSGARAAELMMKNR